MTTRHWYGTRWGSYISSLIGWSTWWRNVVNQPGCGFGGQGITYVFGWTLFPRANWHVIDPLRFVKTRGSSVFTNNSLFGFCSWANRNVILWVLRQNWWNGINLWKIIKWSVSKYQSVIVTVQKHLWQPNMCYWPANIINMMVKANVLLGRFRMCNALLFPQR